MLFGLLLRVGTANSPNIAPAGLIFPILFAVPSVNHRFPSGPGVIQNAPLLGVVIPNSVTVPAGVIRPIAPPAWYSVNQRFPSGPVTIDSGTLFAVGTAHSVIVPVVVAEPGAL